MPPLSFDDLASLDDKSLKLVLQSVVYEHLLPALAFASEGLRARVVGLLDDKARELLFDDLRGEDISESDAAMAQIAIVRDMPQMADEREDGKATARKSPHMSHMKGRATKIRVFPRYP